MINPILRRAVIAAHGYKCVYCGDKASSADHIIPTKKGGKEESKNLISACQKCNSIKGQKRLDINTEAEMLLRAIIAVPLVEQIVDVSIAAEVASRVRKKLPINLSGLEVGK